MPFFSRSKQSGRSAELQTQAGSEETQSPKRSSPMGATIMSDRSLRSKMSLQAGKKYYGDERFSDFTIRCEGKEYHVHRIIISSQSKWFEACCSAPFREASDRSVTLVEDDPTAVDRMIEFFYRGEYWPLTDDGRDDTRLAASGETGPTSPVQLDCYVYAIAEKYDCAGLKQHALKEFKLLLSTASQGQMMAATRAVYQQIELPESDTALKAALLELWRQRRAYMVERQSLETLLKEIPEFAMGVAMKYIC